MKFLSTGVNENVEPEQGDKGSKAMSDVALARSLAKDIGGPGRVNEVLYSAYKRLQKMFPHVEDNFNQWTETRLRNWWYGTSKHVYHWQMRELYEAAAKVKEERELLASARKEHAEFIAKTARLRALLEQTDPDFFGHQVEGLGGQLGRGDRAGTAGDR